MSSHTFSQIPRAEIPRSSFDRSHGHKTTINEGYLYPIFLDEALPGDTFNVKMHALVRMATPIFPIMDNIYVDTHFFAVPYRLLWDNWEKFNGAQTNPGDSTDYVVPVLSGAVTEGSIADYFGLPIGTAVTCSALPFRAYNLIFNEWFRDQNLQNSLGVGTGDEMINLSNYSLQRRGKRHDYFTSCLPWPQKGDSVDIPIGTTAAVIPGTLAGPSNQAPTFKNVAGTQSSRTLNMQIGNDDVGWPDSSVDSSVARWDGTGLIADLSTATAATINSLRQAFQVQKILERDARGGTRYTEILKAHFGVTSPDARLQRPEYLGGYSTPINISQISQTSGTAGTGGYTDTPLGQVGANSTTVLRGNQNSFTSSFTEHCVIIGLMSVRADMTYQQRLDRMWSRKYRFDFYWPALNAIGEQAVLNKEIYHQGSPPDEEVFGYQERYGEYRYKPSQVTGLMRSVSPTSLDAWHLAYDFASLPLLDGTFIQEAPPIDRVVAVPSEPHFIVDTWFEMRCARPMPMYGVPGLIDHF